MGGNPYNARDVAELVQINRPADDPELCWQPPEMPFDYMDAVGSLLNGRITMCGGDDTEKCVQFNTTSREWEVLPVSLPGHRYGAASVLMSEDEWWIFGGSSGPADKLSSTLIHRGDRILDGPDLPSPR